MKRRVARSLFVSSLVVALASCGGDQPAGPSVGKISPGKMSLSGGAQAPLTASTVLVPVSSVPFTASAGQVQPFTITLGQAGVFQIAADWSSSLDDIDIYLTTTDCNSEAMLRAGLCENLIYAKDDSYAKPAYVTVAASGPATAYLWVHDVGPYSENGIIQISVAQ